MAVAPPPPLPVDEAPAREVVEAKPSRPETRQLRRRADSRVPWWMHAAPAALLALAVLGVVLYDRFGPRLLSEEQPPPAIEGPRYDPKQLADSRPRVGVQFNRDTDRFGVVILDPAARDPKRLTFRPDGQTNNTVVRIGSTEYVFGDPNSSAAWVYRRKELPAPYHGWSSTVDYTLEQVRVTQNVQVVPGADNLLDTALIWYHVENRGTLARKVALRVMLDTFIGSNDGVPFTVSGQSGFVTGKAEYKGADVPDYIEAVEHPDDPANPGTIARIGLKGLRWGNVELVDPQRVLICRFPGQFARWEWDVQPIGKGEDSDSAVAVYWPEQELAPKGSFNAAMTYGLGKLEVSEQLALSVPSSARPGAEFVVTAYVYNATKGQKVKLDLPAGVELAGGEAEQAVADQAGRTHVFWKVRAPREGTYQISATSGRARARAATVRVQNRSIFG